MGVCGPKCTRHELTLKSDVDQTVYVTAYSWGKKSIPEECEQKDNGLYHAILVDKIDKPQIFNFGDKALAPFDLKAGETAQVEVEWNFTNDAHARDWSVTAFGDGKKGSLSLTHNKGLKSDSWHPIVRKDNGKKPATMLKPNPDAGKPDVESEAAFVEWLEALTIDGGECSMFKEDSVTKAGKKFSRAAIKSKCAVPVAYGISMNSSDWSSNLSHAYKDFTLVECKVTNPVEDITECIIEVTPDKPLTGWQLSSTAYGVKGARRLDQSELEKVRLEIAKKEK